MRELRKETESLYSFLLFALFQYIRNERTPKGDGKMGHNIL